MIEPQPLDINHVMFCFILLALGICLSTVLAIAELIKSKLLRQKPLTMTIQTTESSVGQNQRRRGSQQWMTREIKFDIESKLDVGNRHDMDAGKDGDQGKEDIMDQVNAVKFNVDNRHDMDVGNEEDQMTKDIMDNVNDPVRHTGEAEGRLKNKHQGTTNKLCTYEVRGDGD